MCNWLSIKQLVFYQSVIMAHKIATTSSPFYLATKMSTTYLRKTRQATTGCIRFREQLSTNQNPIQKSFGNRATVQYNTIPASTRTVRSLPVFRSRLNIPIDW